MPQDLSYYQSVAQRLIESDQERNQMFEGCEAMEHIEYNLPDELARLDWIHKVKSTDPHDAVRAATRVLSSLEPRITYQPLAPTALNKEAAEKIEKTLRWVLMNSGKRRKATLIRDVMRSALMYDCVFCQAINIPWQMKIVGENSKAKKRWRLALRMGDYAFKVYNPKNVHVKSTALMVEAVLLVETMDVWEFTALWGDAAMAARGKLGDDGTGKFDYVTVFDYTDIDDRVVWVVFSENITGTIDAASTSGIEVIREEHELDFIPWAVRIGGSEIEDKPEHEYRPLLYSVYHADQWDTQNIAETLIMSEAIALTSAPQRITKTIDGSGVKIDYTDPGGSIDIRKEEDVAPFQRPSIDTGLMAVSDKLAARIDKSTVSRILQNADLPSNTAFAALNLATQTAVGAIKPYQELGELALADILTLVLYWCAHTKYPIIGYGMGKKDNSYGEQLILTSDDFDVNNVYLTVELTPDVPSDRLQRINAATIAHQTLNYPKEAALEDIGVTDPQAAMRQFRVEQLEDLLFQNEAQMILADYQMKMQMLQAQLQQMMQSLMQPQQPQQQGAYSPYGGPPEDQGAYGMMGAPPGTEPSPLEQMGPGVGGPGFNPAMGGSPPAEAAPDITREAMTGEDSYGQPTEPGF